MSRNSATATQCRYYVYGACRDGENCRYAHSVAARPDTICRYYQRGQCSYGAGCRYDHIRVDRTHSSSNNNHASSNNSPPLSISSSSNETNIRSQETNRRNSSAIKGNVESINRPKSQLSLVPIPSYSDLTKSKSKKVLSATKLRAEAAEFVPAASTSFEGPATYSEAVLVGQEDITGEVEETGSFDVSGFVPPPDLLCPYNLVGHCWYGDSCSFVHGDVCEFCNTPALHPTDKEQRSHHRQECIAIHEQEMESAFAVAKSREMQCGICMEIVLDKSSSSQQRFGILPGCKHCFCLECIRRWRQAKTFEHKIIRACPECRTVSDFVIPSSRWADTDLEKKELIEKYRTAMKEKPCKYFARGSTSGEGTSNDECPFGNKCFYKHQTPDGQIVESDSPRTIRARQRLRRQRQRTGGSDSAAELFAVWSYLRHREASGTSSGDNSAEGAGALHRQLDLLALDNDDERSDFILGGEWHRNTLARRANNDDDDNDTLYEDFYDNGDLSADWLDDFYDRWS